MRIVPNRKNHGFAAAANAGAADARGRVLVLLNNDTIVPPESMGRLVGRLGEESIGLVGPVSNRAATEAEVDISYRTYGQLMSRAVERSRSHAGQTLEVDVLTLYCTAVRRDVYDRVGPLDERFEVGLFEDDDYSRRVHEAGYRVVCAEDVYVHHFGEAAFGPMFRTGEYAELFSANRRRYEEKWGVEWQPHLRRQGDLYRESVDRIRESVRGSVPPGSTVLVVSKGDEELLRFDDRVGAHFPQTDGGTYAGHHPGDSSEAIGQLEALQRGGAEFILFPATGMWWLDYYAELRTYLDSHYSRVCENDDCVIYELAAASRS
jgi:hypothetical protein